MLDPHFTNLSVVRIVPSVQISIVIYVKWGQWGPVGGQTIFIGLDPSGGSGWSDSQGPRGGMGYICHTTSMGFKSVNRKYRTDNRTALTKYVMQILNSLKRLSEYTIVRRKKSV